MTEKKTITLFAILAFLHVMVFSALFPFYQITDEQCHLDLAIHYADQGVPTEYLRFGKESSYYCALYNSLDLVSVQNVDEKLKPDSVQFAAQDAKIWMTWTNHESGQPPLYYLYTGSLWRVFKAVGFKNAALPYAMRCGNGFLLAATVALAWLLSRMLFPKETFIRVAAAGIVACMPQSIYYSVSNDNLVGPAYGLAVYTLYRIWQSPKISAGLGFGAGLSLAGAMLAKFTCLPLVGVAILFVWVKSWRLYRSNQLKYSLHGIGTMMVGFLVPMVAWLSWCKIHFQSWTGTGLKLQLLGWTPKPFGGWFHHPIYTIHGLLFFVCHNIATFWQGEARWHLELLRNPIVDSTYICVNIAVMLTVLIFLAFFRDRLTPLQEVNFKFTFAGIAGLGLFYAWLSVLFDFGGCWYPSKYQPFFTSGRLMLGILVPAVIMVAFAMRIWLSKVGPRLAYLVLGLFLAGMLATEAAVDRPVYDSWYNIIHL